MKLFLTIILVGGIGAGIYKAATPSSASTNPSPASVTQSSPESTANEVVIQGEEPKVARVEYPSGGEKSDKAPCRDLGTGDTVVIIETSTPDRVKLAEQVIAEHNLKGTYCASQRTGRTVWMSEQVEGATSMDRAKNSVPIFDYFRSVGLVSPVNLSRGANQAERPTNWSGTQP
jgi:hypothetical protein